MNNAPTATHRHTHTCTTHTPITANCKNGFSPQFVFKSDPERQSWGWGGEEIDRQTGRDRDRQREGKKRDRERDLYRWGRQERGGSIWIVCKDDTTTRQII